MVTPEEKITNYKYDVALSFAGEDRRYVNDVAYILIGSGIKVFYDDFYKADLWGKNLYTHLKKIYSEQAKYTVIFISKYYAQKTWTNLEREAAQERAFKESEPTILPVRFDDTKIPGLSSTTGFIDLKGVKPYELCKLIGQKLYVDIIAETEINKVLVLSIDLSDDEFSRNNRDKIDLLKAALDKQDFNTILLFGSKIEEKLFFTCNHFLEETSSKVSQDTECIKRIISIINDQKMLIKKMIPNRFILFLTKRDKERRVFVEGSNDFFDELSDIVEL